jgi:hypothetical protein
VTQTHCSLCTCTPSTAFFCKFSSRPIPHAQILA